jgi:carbamoyltransferase
MGLTVGLSGSAKHGCVAVSDGKRILGVCEQERATRVRAAGFNSSGLPDEALDLLLGHAGRSRSEIVRYAFSEKDRGSDFQEVVRMGQHHAFACAAYLSSPFTSAVVVVCDLEAPKVSVWSAEGSKVTQIDWPWAGLGFFELYSECARLSGFGIDGSQLFEAMARLQPDYRDARLDTVLRLGTESLLLAKGWESDVANWLPTEDAGTSLSRRVRQAAALQGRIGELLVTFLERVRAAINSEHLCLAGNLFLHSSINSLVRNSRLFSRVFIPVNAGTAGLAVGTALYATGSSPERLSPFLGPSYSQGQIKSTLDNCKLHYVFTGQSGAIERAVEALREGRFVGWFEGGMEWGPRALGARSILANPFAPYVLDNLNHFLKRREPWRGYAISTLESSLEDFEGPDVSPFMESDFRPRNTEKFRHVLPSPKAAIRVHVVGDESPPGFRELLRACASIGITSLVNTSFNGFHEPIVCSPRDAIRVFYGTGVDVLCLDGFVLVK